MNQEEHPLSVPFVQRREINDTRAELGVHNLRDFTAGILEVIVFQWLGQRGDSRCDRDSECGDHCSHACEYLCFIASSSIGGPQQRARDYLFVACIHRGRERAP